MQKGTFTPNAAKGIYWMTQNSNTIAIALLVFLLGVAGVYGRFSDLRRFHIAKGPLAAVHCNESALRKMTPDRRLLCGRGVHLNTDSAQALATLPGIGPVRAASIVAHRKKHGPFRSVSELTAIKGIGDKTVATLLPWVEPL